MELDVNMPQICRTCLQESGNKTLTVPIDYAEADSEPTICHKLNSCVPELDLSIVPNATVCEDCVAAINSAYKFKSRCLRAELQIRRYLQQESTSAFVNLAQLKQVEHTDLIDIKAEPISADVSSMKEEHKVGKIEGLETQQDYLLQLEIVDMQSVLFNTDDGYVSYGVESEQNNQDSPNSSGNGKQCVVHNLAKADVFYQCYTCGHRSKSKIELILHLNIHASKKQYNGVTSKNAHFQNREKICSVDTPFNCTKCEYKASRKEHLKKHMMTHTKDKPFKCSKCEYGTGRQDHLKQHMWVHTEAKPFKCTLCKYKTSRKEHLKRHTLTHTEDKAFKCTKCEFKTSWKRSLNQHMMTHTGDKPFKCIKCEYRTSDRSHLKRHIRTHTGDKPFKCTKCEYRTSNRGNLKRHVMKHTGDKSFKCTKCEHRTSNRGNLKKHMMNHTGDKEELYPRQIIQELV